MRGSSVAHGKAEELHMTNYIELKKAAEAATPGPWEWPNKGF